MRATISTSLAQIKGAAQTEYSDPSGTFLLSYRAFYKRFGGDSPLQIHYMSLQIMIHFVTSFVLGAVSGPLQVLADPRLHEWRYASCA